MSVASFFEGYDFFALNQFLPHFRQLHVGIAGRGLLVGFITVGTILAFISARKADRWGRKPVLTATIAGYPVFTFLSGLSTARSDRSATVMIESQNAMARMSATNVGPPLEARGNDLAAGSQLYPPDSQQMGLA